MKYGIDILAFGAHADDVEIGMGGSIAKWAEEGKRIVICDVTKAQLSSNGTVDSRIKEAEQAGHILGIQERINLGLQDRGLYINEENISKIAEAIRRYRPAYIFAPYSIDRHPDHGNCSKLVEEASFSAGIRKYCSGGCESPHKAKGLFFYMINGFHHPDFAVDISSHEEKKIAALHAYGSQFLQGDSGVKTPLTEGYVETVTARDRLFGKESGVSFAEGYKTKQPLLVNFSIDGEEIWV